MVDKETINKDMILMYIRNSPKTISQLANILELSRPTIYLHLSSLEKKGFIRREKDVKKKGAPVTIYPVEVKINEEEEKQAKDVLKLIKENNGIDYKDIDNLLEEKKINKITAQMHLQWRGFITKKIFITPEGEKFLKEHSEHGNL